MREEMRSKGEASRERKRKGGKRRKGIRKGSRNREGSEKIRSMVKYSYNVRHIPAP